MQVAAAIFVPFGSGRDELLYIALVALQYTCHSSRLRQQCMQLALLLAALQAAALAAAHEWTDRLQTQPLNLPPSHSALPRRSKQPDGAAEPALARGRDQDVCGALAALWQRHWPPGWHRVVWISALPHASAQPASCTGSSEPRQRRPQRRTAALPCSRHCGWPCSGQHWASRCSCQSRRGAAPGAAAA